jgi:hypothetical protein
MTVASEAYSALRAWTGAETSFAAGFSAAAASDVKVYSRDAAGTDTLLSQGSHYGLTLAGDGSVTILPINLPPPPVTLVIVRDTPATQSTDFEDLETFSADDHERLHDARARTDGELKGAFARALRFPFGELAPMLPTSLLRKAGGIGSVLGFRGDTGEPVLVSPDAPIAPAAPIDYQEANWSPVIEGDATPGLQTYATQFGRYVRVGNMVTVTALIVMSAKDGATAGNIQIGGLPFISRNVAALRGAADIGFTQNWDLDVAGGFYTLSGLILNNSTKIQMWQGGDNVVGKRVVAANIGNATAIQLNATYFIGTEIISEGNDTFTKALLHFDGAKFTTAIVDSNAGGSPHVWTAVGNAQIDTLQSVFGGASLLLDGTGDYVTTPAHADFNLGSGDFTIEGRFRCISTTGTTRGLIGQSDATPTAAGFSFTVYRLPTNQIIGAVSNGAAFTTVTGTTQFIDALKHRQSLREVIGSLGRGRGLVCARSPDDTAAARPRGQIRSSLRGGRAIPGEQPNCLRVGADYSQPSVSSINQPRNTT